MQKVYQTIPMPTQVPEAPARSANIRSLFKRPESVLVLVYTVDLDVLLICRKSPVGFWQSVTGSLEALEKPPAAAQRELFEETGIQELVVDHRISRCYPIKNEWRKRYAPGVRENLEHEFSVQVPARCDVILDPAEHVDYCWLPIRDAIAKVHSHSNRAALKELWAAEG